MENKAHALAAGAFVLVLSALLVLLGWWLSHDGAVRTIYELSSRDNITGLQPQAAVRYRGVLVGKVTEINFDPQTPGNVLIRIAVDNSAPITRSTYATLGFQGVTGQAHILLDDSGTSREPLDSADDPPRIPMRPSLVGRLTDQGTQVLKQVEDVTKRLNQLLSPDNQKVLIGSVGNAGQAAQNIGQLAADLRLLLGTQQPVSDAGSDHGSGTPAPAANVAAVLQRAQATLLALQGTVEATRQTVTQVGQSVQQLQAAGGTLDQLQQGAAALNQGATQFNQQTLPRLNQVSEDLARSARQAGRTATLLGDNPQMLLYGPGAAPPGPGESGFSAPATVPVATPAHTTP